MFIKKRVREYMKNVKFKPWIGPEYNNNGIDGLKILILGESHYGDKEYEDVTSDVIRKYVISGQPYAFFTKIAKCILQIPVEDKFSMKQRTQIWNSVAFYNYIQTFIGNNPRERPNDDMWNNTEKPFRETINYIKPHVCVVLGCELWKHLPSPEEKLHSNGYETYIYNIEDGQKMFAGGVVHPSGRMSYGQAYPRIKALINMAKLV